MRVSEETISPKRARELLDKHWVKDHQRKPTPSVVDDYARTMRAGQWMLTHQGIAIDTQDEMIDGIHRLLAIEQSGCSVRMLITRGVESNGASSKGGLYAIDAIDRGRLRDVGQQLNLRHGYANGNAVAAATWGVILTACHVTGIAAGRSSTAKALHVLDVFGDEVRHCVDNRPSLPGLRLGAVMAAFAIAMRPFPGDVKPAFDRFVSGEDLHRGDPIYTLRNFLLGSQKSTGGSTVINRVRATSQALNYVVEKQQLKAIKSHSEIGVNFFVEKQRPTFNKLLLLCGYTERR